MYSSIAFIFSGGHWINLIMWKCGTSHEFNGTVIGPGRGQASGLNFALKKKILRSLDMQRRFQPLRHYELGDMAVC